jgi:hypothetical protein
VQELFRGCGKQYYNDYWSVKNRVIRGWCVCVSVCGFPCFKFSKSLNPPRGFVVYQQFGFGHSRIQYQ